MPDNNSTFINKTNNISHI